MNWEDLSNEEFVAAFIKKHRPLIKTVGRKYLIPNRYAIQDIEGYITERLLAILYSRQDSDNKILDREKYFLNCLVFYCIEYQRLNGFVFCLPKRPRKNAIADELDAKSRQFQYINHTMYDDPSLVDYNGEAEDPGVESAVWSALTGHMHNTDADVIDCVHRKNMTLKETSLYLGVAQSTCLTRRDRAYRTIFRIFDSMSGDISGNIKKLLRSTTVSLEEE